MKMDDMNKQSLSRREFNRLCAALGSSLPAVSAMFAVLSSASVIAAATGAASNGARTVSSTTAPSSRRSVRALGISRREDIRKLLKKKRCAQAFRSG